MKNSIVRSPVSFHLAIALLIGAVASYLALTLPGTVNLLSGLVIALAGGYFLASHPRLPLHLLILVLPASNLILTLLYQYAGLPPRGGKVLLAWKELLVLAAFSLAIWRLLAPRSWRLSLTVRIQLVDLLVVMFAALVLVYIGLVPVITPEMSAVDLLRSARDLLIFLLAYGVGRLTPLDDVQSWRVLRSLALLSIATSVFGLFERFFVPIEFFLQIGLPRFYSDIVGYSFPAYALGLPENFWGAFGNRIIRRATSVYTSSQPFAISFMILLPTCMWLASRSRRGPVAGVPSPRAMIVWTVVAFGALVATVTRANIALGALQLLLCTLLLRVRPFHVNRRIGVIMALLTCCAVAGAVVAYRPLLGLVGTTLTFQEASSAQHRDSWLDDLDHLAEYPFGRGIGTAGITAARSSADYENSAGGEGQYSKILRELGIIGLVLYVGILLTVAITGFRAVGSHRASLDGRSGISFVVFAASIAFLLNALTTEWHGAASTALTFWCLAGAVVGHVVVRKIDAAHTA